MGRKLQQALGGVGVLLLALSLAAPVPGQSVKDLVVTVSYLNINPAQANSWLVSFKKHFEPAIKELQEQGALLGWHLFVPGIHHPGYTWTHALVLASKDRAAQAVVEKKFQEAVAAMPPAEVKKFYAAIDTKKYFDDEWREVNLEAVEVPEAAEKKEEEEGKQ